MGLRADSDSTSSLRELRTELPQASEGTLKPFVMATDWRCTAFPCIDTLRVDDGREARDTGFKENTAHSILISLCVQPRCHVERMVME